VQLASRSIPSRGNGSDSPDDSLDLPARLDARGLSMELMPDAQPGLLLVSVVVMKDG
jgi:hypothetical protein